MDATSRLIRLTRSFTPQAKLAAARLRTRLDDLQDHVYTRHKSEAHRRRSLIHAASDALQGGGSVAPSVPSAIAQAEAVQGWLASAEPSRLASCNGDPVELYITTVVDAAKDEAAETDPDFDVTEFEAYRRRELDPDANDLPEAERPFLLGKWIAEEARCVTRPRSLDEVRELCVGLVVADGLELTMTELGFDEEWDVGFSSPGEDFFGMRDGVSDYADLHWTGLEAEGPVSALRTFVADRLEAVLHGVHGETQAKPPKARANRRRRGRPRASDPKQDERTADRWRASGEKTYEQYALRIGLDPKQVRRAVDRDRKRRKK